VVCICDDWDEGIEKAASDDHHIQSENMQSRKNFEVMEEFSNSVTDRFPKIGLLSASDGSKPFSNFKCQIENSVSWGNYNLHDLRAFN